MDGYLWLRHDLSPAKDRSEREERESGRERERKIEDTVRSLML